MWVNIKGVWKGKIGSSKVKVTSMDFNVINMKVIVINYIFQIVVLIIICNVLKLNIKYCGKK